MRILGLIPARGGSKGVARKNVRPLWGRPLIAWTIEAARGARLLTRTIVSTDDQEIAAIARAAGAEVPFERPAALAADDTPTLPVVLHALEMVEKSDQPFDAVCLLQPTNPLRTAQLIDDCIRRFISSDADSLVSVLPVPPKYNPHWVYFSDLDGSLRLSTGAELPISRRQDLPPAFHREGSIYLTRRRVLVELHSLYGARTIGYPVDPESSLNIDTPADWERAEQLQPGDRRD